MTRPFVSDDMEVDLVTTGQFTPIFNIIDRERQKEDFATLFVAHSAKAIAIVGTLQRSKLHLQVGLIHFTPWQTNYI